MVEPRFSSSIQRWAALLHAAANVLSRLDRLGSEQQMAPTHEDRAIILRFKELGLPVVHSKDVTVYASCQLEDRAPGGMAAALRERAEDRDAPSRTNMGKSDSPEMRQILMGLGPLNMRSDLPEAVATLECLLGLDGRGKV